MNAKTLALDQYNRERRRLNARLGFLLVALTPVPGILIRAGLPALQMLTSPMRLDIAVRIAVPESLVVVPHARRPPPCVRPTAHTRAEAYRPPRPRETVHRKA